jgi:hypothetical protein
MQFSQRSGRVIVPAPGRLLAPTWIPSPAKGQFLSRTFASLPETERWDIVTFLRTLKQ